MSSRRESKTFDFTPPDINTVAGYLQVVTDAADGWINLMPGVEIDERERTNVPSGAFAIFGTKQPPVTMVTLMPAKANRQEFDGVTVGLMHPIGSKVVPVLAQADTPVPTGWVVRQDHNRRGLVVRTPLGTSARAIITWSISAGTALCREKMTGEWQAVVYLP